MYVVIEARNAEHDKKLHKRAEVSKFLYGQLRGIAELTGR